MSLQSMLWDPAMTAYGSHPTAVESTLPGHDDRAEKVLTIEDPETVANTPKSAL